MSCTERMFSCMWVDRGYSVDRRFSVNKSEIVWVEEDFHVGKGSICKWILYSEL